MRTFGIGLALGLTVACGASGLETIAIGAELAGKGIKASKEAEELMRRERPQAAVVVLNRHLKEIDEAIETVKNDSMISGQDKPKILVELQQYRREHKAGVDKVRAYANMHSDLSVR